MSPHYPVRAILRVRTTAHSSWSRCVLGEWLLEGDLRTHDAKPRRFSGDNASRVLSQRFFPGMHTGSVIPPIVWLSNHLVLGLATDSTLANLGIQACFRATPSHAAR